MRRVTDAVAVGLGVGLLLLAAPHRNPWDRTLIVAGTSGPALSVPGLAFEFAAWPALVALLLVWAGLTYSRARAAGMRRVTPSRAGIVFGLYFLVTIVPSPRGAEIIVGTLLATLGVGYLMLGVGETLARPLDRLRAWAEAVRPRTWAGLLFLVAFVLSAAADRALLGGIPHVVDATVQYFHAKILLGGSLTAALPEAPDAFRFTHMIGEGRWYSQYPPGFVALLAIGELVRLPWLVNPLLAGLSVVLIYLTGRDWYDERTGRLAGLLAALSPFVILQGASFMSHTSTLFCFCLFLFAYHRALRASPGWAAIAGFAIGYAVLIRPYTAVALGLPFALHALVGMRRRPGSTAVMALAFTVPVVALLAYNQATNGDPLLFGYEVLYGENHRPGFGRSGFWHDPHTPLRGLHQTLDNFNALNPYLTGWPIPALLLPLAGLAWIRRRSEDALLLSSATLLAVAYFFYWFQDWAFGPRFIFEATAAWLLLTARAVVSLPGFLTRTFARIPEARAFGIVATGVAICMIYGLAVHAPMLASFYGRNFADGNRAAVQAVREQLPDEPSIVFVPTHLFASFFALNSPRLDGPVVYARDLGPARNADLLRRLASGDPRRGFRLVSLDSYRLLPFPDDRRTTTQVYPVTPGEPLTMELTTSQMASIENGYWRDESTGEYGAGWRNHDQLLITAPAPGAQTAVLLGSVRPQTRTMRLRVTRGPRCSSLSILLDDRPLAEPFDLRADERGLRTLTLDRVPLAAGVNRLTFRIAGGEPVDDRYSIGLDTLTLE